MKGKDIAYVLILVILFGFIVHQGAQIRYLHDELNLYGMSIGRLYCYEMAEEYHRQGKYEVARYEMQQCHEEFPIP